MCFIDFFLINHSLHKVQFITLSVSKENLSIIKYINEFILKNHILANLLVLCDLICFVFPVFELNDNLVLNY